jgi:hypothetical protein
MKTTSTTEKTMTRIGISNQSRPALAAPLPAALLISAVLGCHNALAWAEERTQSTRSPSNGREVAATLEAAFWACDYAATTRGVFGSEGATCGEIYENVKRRKFGGDFQALLVWWQRNKAAEHQLLAAARVRAMHHHGLSDE